MAHVCAENEQILYDSVCEVFFYATLTYPLCGRTLLGIPAFGQEVDYHSY